MTWRAIFAFVLVVMIAASIGMAVAAVERSPEWFLNPGARPYLAEVVFALVVYAGVIVIVVANRGEEWDEELRNAAIFGSTAGLVDVASFALEHVGFAERRLPAVTLAAMLVMFVLWALAGARTSMDHGHFRPGVNTAFMSAGVSMVIAVTVGFAIDLFIAPPAPDLISTWAEFKRSGWTDAQAFGIANTFDSAFTHLWMGPLIALLVGSIGAWIGKMKSARR
jgi:hypothetical protein